MEYLHCNESAPEKFRLKKMGRRCLPSGALLGVDRSAVQKPPNIPMTYDEIRIKCVFVEAACNLLLN